LDRVRFESNVSNKQFIYSSKIKIIPSASEKKKFKKGGEREKKRKKDFIVRIFHFNCKTTNFLLRQVLSAKKIPTLNKHQLQNIFFFLFLTLPLLPSK